MFEMYLVLWNVGQSLGILVWGTVKGVRSAQSNESCFLAVVAFLFFKLNLYRAPG